MADPLSAAAASAPAWERAPMSTGPTPTALTPPTWTAGPRIPVVVGPVYFLYGGASVWVLVR